MIGSTSILSLFLNEFRFSGPGINLSTLLMPIPFNTYFAPRLETLETHFQDILHLLQAQIFNFFSMKPNRFLANRVLPPLFRRNFFTPFLEACINAAAFVIYTLFVLSIDYIWNTIFSSYKTLFCIYFLHSSEHYCSSWGH